MQTHQHQGQLEILNIEHQRIVSSINNLIDTLEQQYQLAANILTSNDKNYKYFSNWENPSNNLNKYQNQVKRKELESQSQSQFSFYYNNYTINLGLIHTVMTNIETIKNLIQILKKNPINLTLKNNQQQISAYLMEQLNYPLPVENLIKQEQFNPQSFIQKHQYSSEITLQKSLITQGFVKKICQACRNIYTINLHSDSLDQKGQIQDSDITKFTKFQNISVLSLRDSAITDNSIQFLSKKMNNIKKLDISGCYMLTQRSIKLLSQCKLVTIIMDNVISLKNNSIIQLIKSSINLNYLEIKDCPNISEEIFLNIYQVYQNNPSSLKWIQVSSDHGIDLFINKLTYLTSENPIQQITDEELKTLIGKSPPKYTGLYFQNCQELTKKSINLIVDKCKKLKRLALSKFINLTDRLVQDITLLLPSLTFLDLNNCYNITDYALFYIGNNLQIQYLGLQKCFSITDQGLIYTLNSVGKEKILKKNSNKSKCKSKQKHRKQQQIKLINRKLESEVQIISNSLNQSHMNTQIPEEKEEIKYKIKLKHLNIAHCRKITDYSLSQISQFAHQLKYLNLQCCDQITDISIESISQQLHNLEYLNLNQCQGLTDSSISMIATRLSQKLKVLQIEWCQVSQNCIRLITQNLINLQKLNLSYCPSVFTQQMETLSRNMPKLHTLKLQSCSKITQHAFIKVASLRELKIISIKQCTYVSDTFVKLLTTNNKYLEYLDVSWCVQITDKSLFSIAKNCLALKHLNLNGCIQITDEGIQWLSTTVSQIQYLNLTLCSKLTDLAILQITSKLNSLKYLHLSELQELTDIGISSISNLDKLQHLILAGCTNITNSSLIGLLHNIQKLTELNISRCRSLDGKYLNKLCKFMTNIKILQISELQIDGFFLQELALNCPKLAYINLCYCNSISDDAVLKLLQMVPRVEKIDIQNTSITERTKSMLFHALNSRRMANIVLQ